MADVPFYSAYVSVTDSAKRTTNVSLRVDATDGKAYVAAADTAARAATKVGLLLAAVIDVMNATLGGTGEVEHGVKSGFKNGSYAPFNPLSEIFNSNKLNIIYSTNNAGVPAQGGFSIPQRDPSEYVMESNGINVSLADGAAIEELVTQIEDTVLSVYGTAVTVLEITVNDE